jgi:hypothetical protein
MLVGQESTQKKGDGERIEEVDSANEVHVDGDGEPF